MECSSSVVESDWFKKGIFNHFEFTEDSIKSAEANCNNKLSGICILCKPVRTVISGRKNVTSNFRKHLQVSFFSKFLMLATEIQI